MSTRYVFFTVLSMYIFLIFCRSEKDETVSTDTDMTDFHTQDEDELKELKELQNQIRRAKFDIILPQIMREYEIDMWIHVMREGIVHSFGHYVDSYFYADLGSHSGVFIFTDRGGDRIERAVLGRRWKEPDTKYFLPTPDPDLIEKCGAYDIIAEPVSRRELPGGPKTEFDHRFEGIGEFVAKRNPKHIALNYLEKLGPHERSPSNDGISHTDYLLLTEELGDKYAKMIVNDRQKYYKELDSEKTQVSVDLHGVGKGSYAPRIGSYGPDWQHNMTLQLYHHFVMEMFIYMPLPSGGNGEDHLRLLFHDGAIVTERGVEYLSPPLT